MSSASLVPPVAGQFADVTVQVAPTAVSVQALMTVLPASSEEIFAPVAAVPPPDVVAIRIVTLVKSLEAAFESLESYSSSGQALRRKMRARWVSLPAANERSGVLRLPVSSVPLDESGTARGKACTSGSSYCRANTRLGSPAFLAATTR